MTRQEKMAEAKRLRVEERLTYKQIGERLGISLVTAYDYCTGRVSDWKRRNADKVRASNLARNDKKRAYERARAGKCACGAPLSKPSCEKCPGCDRQARRDEGRERTLRYIALRQDGLNNCEIAEREGTSSDAIATALYRAPRYGLEVPPSPYRRSAAA